LKYKGINSIIRSGQPLDNIVGRMTITQMDNDLLYAPKPQDLEAKFYAPVEISTMDDDLQKSVLSFRPGQSALSGGVNSPRSFTCVKRQPPSLNK
jgi:hypothetical protein